MDSDNGIATKEPLVFDAPRAGDRPPAGSGGERISESDRQMIIRMETEIACVQRLQAFVSNHMALTYRLQQGDEVIDGVICRATPPEGPLEPER